MAQTLSKTGITTNSTIQAWHVTQSVDALTGTVAYDITISGSLTLTGSVKSKDGFTGSLLGTAATSSVAQSVKVTNNATTNQNYRLLFAAESGLPNPNADGYAQPRFDSGSDGSGLYYNPSTNTLYASKISGSNDGSTPDFVGTGSYALTASVAESALNSSVFIPNFAGIDNVTYTASTPFVVQGNAPFYVYVSQSVGSILGLSFSSVGVTSGKQVTFVPQYQSNTLSTNFIGITASTVPVYGIGGNVINIGNKNTANNLGIGDVNSLTFQYIGTPSSPIFPTVGWYLINVNQN